MGQSYTVRKAQVLFLECVQPFSGEAFTRALIAVTSSLVRSKSDDLTWNYIVANIVDCTVRIFCYYVSSAVYYFISGLSAVTRKLRELLSMIAL